MVAIPARIGCDVLAWLGHRAYITGQFDKGVLTECLVTNLTVCFLQYIL